MSYNHHLPKKIDLRPKKHHGFQVVLWLLGLLVPPLGEYQSACERKSQVQCRLSFSDMHPRMVRMGVGRALVGVRGDAQIEDITDRSHRGAFRYRN